MTKKQLPSPELLRKVLRYEAETGKLFWLVRPNMRKSWNTRYAGKEAFAYKNRRGYLRGAISGKCCKAHRVIWAIVHGVWPDQIDHINHDKSDNRIENLRSVYAKDNAKNMSKSKANTSGYTGVTWSTKDSKWYSRIMIEGKCKHLGSFDDINDAIAVRLSANEKYNFHANHGKSRRSNQ